MEADLNKLLFAILKRIFLSLESSIQYELPVAIEESSLTEPAIGQHAIDEQPPPLTFQIVEGASKRGQQKLFDSHGHSYCVKRRRNEIRNQALWRKVQELVLQTAYTTDHATSSYIRRLMALPFLPHETIEATFESLRPEATTQPLKEFVHYIGETWINSRVWPPKCWSVFMLSVRTNNDIEGWHHALNRRAAGRCGLPFYLLVSLLHNEARLVSLQIRLVSERKLKRIQRAAYRQLQSRLFELWESFNKREKSLKQLLKGCANINIGQ